MSWGGLVICLAWKTTVYLRTYSTVTGAKPFGWYNMWRGSLWAPKVERNIDKGNKNRRRLKLTGCLLKHCRHRKSFSSNLDEAGPHDYICTLSNRDWQQRIGIFLCVALIAWSLETLLPILFVRLKAKRRCLKNLEMKCYFGSADKARHPTARKLYKTIGLKNVKTCMVSCSSLVLGSSLVRIKIS